MATELLAVIEVKQSARVRCQAPGCNHPVYKSIHVVQDGGEIRVLGSSCFRTRYAGTAIVRRKPSYTSGDGRRLTEEEIALLVSNTEALIGRLREDYERQRSLGAASSTQPLSKPRLSSIERQAALKDARAVAFERVKQRHPDLADLLHTPGFSGLVVFEYRAVLRERGLQD